jgi:hypothetical protein
MPTLNVEASGLGGFVNTPLAQLYIYDKIMDTFFERDFLAEITNSEIQERISSCAQEVQIIKAPQVGGFKNYQEGQEMIHERVTFTATKLSICYAAYLAFEFDEKSINYTCDWGKYEEKILEMAYESFVDYQRSFVLGELISLAHPRNQGINAGLRGEYNLGAPGSPIGVTPQNIILLLGSLQTLLSEYVDFVEGQMFLIVPIQFRSIFLLSNYSNQAWTGLSGPSTAIDGMWTQMINGFKIIETIHLPYKKEGSHHCYYMIAGHKDAYAYASDIIGERVMRGENTWTIKYQMLSAWGGAMLYPEFIALVYCYFDPQMTM